MRFYNDIRNNAFNYGGGHVEDFSDLLTDSRRIAAAGHDSRAAEKIKVQSGARHYKRLHFNNARHTSDAAAARMVFRTILPFWT